VPEKEPQWFSDVEFWERFAPVMFDDAHWAEVPLVADAVTRLLRFDLYRAEKSVSPSGASSPKILDLCCGFGRISAELARMGYAVTGVDITESYLKTAREEAAYENLDIEYINSEARNFTRPEFFDAVVNL
jgi:2-polyprenyl-3-methyl-5-hydroxy-6-metoxy-1,4-benzoquinol methylase